MIKFWENKKFDVEHALMLSASKFLLVEAKQIYDNNTIKEFDLESSKYHIYMIGFLPQKKILAGYQEGNNAVIKYKIGSDTRQVNIPLPPGCVLSSENDFFYAENEKGEKYALPEHEIMKKHFSDILCFDVKYIGQSYGQDGSRNAFQRLKNHETLQKIAVKGTPTNQVLCILFIEVALSNTTFTVINPLALSENNGSRIDQGLRKTFDTDEQERISLYEASMIRYFRPQFNKEFKNSFPSTKLQILKKCYEKDFSAITSEISLENAPFKIKSDAVSAEFNHLCTYHLHKETERRVFFGMNDTD